MGRNNHTVKRSRSNGFRGGVMTKKQLLDENIKRRKENTELRATIKDYEDRFKEAKAVLDAKLREIGGSDD